MDTRIRSSRRYFRETKNSGGLNGKRGDGTPTYVELLPDPERPTCDSLDLLRTEFGDDRSPLAHSRRTDTERPRDIRGALKVIDNVLLQHELSITTVQNEAQPQFPYRMLTSVQMETLAERLEQAMKEIGVSKSDLARACKVSPVAAGKWLKGGQMKADSQALVARALGVREEWLRTGKLPRERNGAEEDRQIERVIGLLIELREPLAALSSAIDSLTQSQVEPARKRMK